MKKLNALPDQVFSTTESGVIRTLLYFDIFHYPLTLEEVIKFHPEVSQREDIVTAISDLRNRLILFKHHNFYSLHPGTADVKRRIAGNKLARKRLKTAQWFSRLISFFPFVRGVMLSGSLSKDYMDATSDIDYFVVTAPGRLWFTRGMLALFKRVFLLNSRKFFCVNYLIDTESIEIEEKNFYTAIETTTLVPVYGKNVFEKFIANNHWTKNYLPNATIPRTAFIEESTNLVKKILEKIFNGRIGEKLDGMFMNLAIKRWKYQFGEHLTAEEFEQAFRSRRNVSKNHPRLFQKHTLKTFQERIDEFETLSKMKLSA
jgi:hypothetical protein